MSGRIPKRSVRELLVLCLRGKIDGEDVARLYYYSESDWEDVVELAKEHGVAPLVYHSLSGRSITPDSAARTIDELKKVCRQSAFESLRLSCQLSEVLGSLRSHDIPVIALKGVHLAEVVYRSIALRPMFDIDLLVREPDLPEIEQNLTDLGYRPHRDRGWYLANHFHLPFVLPHESGPLEVHWHIQSATSRLELPVEELWDRAQPGMIAGVEILLLAPEDLLLHSCLHVSRHAFSMGIRPLCDIERTIEFYGERIDWSQVCLRADRWGAHKDVYLPLLLATDMLGALVPDHVLSELRPDDYSERIFKLAKERVLAGRIDDTSDAVARFSCLQAQMDRAHGIREKATILLKSAFPRPRVVKAKYPVRDTSWAVYLCYVRHLTDLVFSHSRAGWSMVHNKRDEAVATAKGEGILLEWLGGCITDTGFQG